jgi:hypothetical protein
MSRSKPIWHDVTACIYKNAPSFGAKDTSEINHLVGSGPKNSQELSTTLITRRFEHHEKYGDIVIFRHSVDGVIIKEAIFEDKNGRAGKHIKTRTALKRVKGL